MSLDALYEIALAIEPQKTLEQTAEHAATAFVEALDCGVGAVFSVDDTGVSVLAAVSADTSDATDDDRVQAGREHLNRVTEQQSFHARRTTDDGTQYHLFGLPSVGAVLLGSVSTETAAKLDPVIEKLSRACRSARQTERLRGVRRRFAAVFEGMPEPVVSVEIQHQTKRIRCVNEAFERTFGYEDQPLRGRELDSLIRPPDQPDDTDAIQRALEAGTPLTSELVRTTPSGRGHFLFRCVPLTPSEYVGVYVDITEQKRREQTLERLYDATQQVLDESSRQEICRQTVETVESVLGFSSTGVHLYDRETEALEPVATSEQVREVLDGGPDSYTDRDTIVWESYVDGQPVHVPDTSHTDEQLPTENTPTDSLVIVPIGVHGVFITSAVETNAFDDEDVDFLRLLGQFVEVGLDREANEDGLAAAQRTVRETIHADSHTEMADRVLDAIPQMFDLPIAGVWKHQPARQVLEPLGVTDQAAALFGDPPAIRPDDGIAWQTFDEGSTSIVSDVSTHPNVYNENTEIEEEILVPIGEFGILTAGSTYENSFTDLDAEVLEILATNLEAVAAVIDRRQDVDLLDQVLDRVLRHNVRNKLTTIRGYASTIQREADGQLDGDVRRIVKNCDELRKTTEHAREMRRIVRTRDEVTSMSLSAVARSAVRTVGEEFSDEMVRLSVESTPEVTAHPDLEAAISQLIRNGIEHNTCDQPRVSVCVTETTAGPTVEVADNGPGIEAEELEVLDEHGESALEHGSGAGLWAVDRVVEYSEALLAFDTDDGTTARITFP